VTVADRGGVTLITVDRPPANALNVDLVSAIARTLEELRADPPSALVVAGRPGFFSAGVDLKEAPGYAPADRRAMVEGINAMALAAYALPCPVVGAITGHAIAGGLVLALCADVRVASDDGRYGLTEVQVGVPYPQAAIGVVRAELAPNAARTLALGNELVDAGACVRLGVFDEVVEPERVVPRAMDVASRLASYPADVYARTKRELRGATVAALRNAAAEDPLLSG
jgi:enoyl-CoA hydratase/carnithine racemase